MERIDRKFDVAAICTEHGHEHTHMDAIVMLAKDRAVPDTLRYYKSRCEQLGADARQLQGIDLLIERVDRYQQEHPGLVKVADVDPTPAGDAIIAPNEAA